MVKCEACRKTLTATATVKCTNCSAAYHRSCADLPESGARGWLCSSCEMKSNPKCKDHSIDLGLEIRCFRDELSALRLEVRAYRDEIAEFKSTLSTCKAAIDVMDARLASLENKSDDCTIQDAIVELETQINERHQEVLANDVEIAGVPESIDENVHQLVKFVSKKLGVEVSDSDIAHAERIGSIPQEHNDRLSKVTSKAATPRRIAVGFTRRITREHLIQAARLHRGISSADMNITGTPLNVYVNERLTPHNKYMFYLARKAGNEYKWKFIWTKNGKIFARKASDEQAERIRSIKDLDKIFSPGTAN